MLAVLRNTLYLYVRSLHPFLVPFPSFLSSFCANDSHPLSRFTSPFWFLTPLFATHRYGGIFERGSKEYTLDDFYSVQLDKMDRFVCLKESEVVVPPEGGEDEESSSDDDDEEGDESGDDDSDDEDIWYGDEDEDEGEGEGDERRARDDDVENQRDVEVEREDDANEDEPDEKGNEKQKPKKQKKKSKKKKDEDVETVAPEADLSQAIKDEDEFEDDSSDLRKKSFSIYVKFKNGPNYERENRGRCTEYTLAW